MIAPGTSPRGAAAKTDVSRQNIAQLASTMESRSIALLGALLFICRPAEAFVSVVGPATASSGARGFSLAPGASAPSKEHARGSVSTLAGRRSRAGGALSMGAKSVSGVAARGLRRRSKAPLLLAWGSKVERVLL